MEEGFRPPEVQARAGMKWDNRRSETSNQSRAVPQATLGRRAAAQPALSGTSFERGTSFSYGCGPRRTGVVARRNSRGPARYEWDRSSSHRPRSRRVAPSSTNLELFAAARNQRHGSHSAHKFGTRANFALSITARSRDSGIVFQS